MCFKSSAWLNAIDKLKLPQFLKHVLGIRKTLLTLLVVFDCASQILNAEQVQVDYDGGHILEYVPYNWTKYRKNSIKEEREQLELSATVPVRNGRSLVERSSEAFSSQVRINHSGVSHTLKGLNMTDEKPDEKKMAFECQPLKTLEEVDKWTADDIFNKIKQSTVELRERGHIDDTVPRTLVCHDMRGGYLEDRFVQGDSEDKSYVFYNWQLIDIFVYFSHNFITIPPVTWINAAHRNGVKILGTFITEWDDGFDRCETFLSSESAFQALADKLVTMTTFYKFDGWLINIENKIKKEKVSVLNKFVEYLTQKLHQALPGSLVIWYDSVITTGELRWQDQLNDKNSMFFDVCDGIFLNYCWDTEKLKNSKELSMSKNRPLDVYVGIDVFGRGCLGGGGFNTIQALTAVRQFTLSAAIFAQGWVFEKYQKDNFLSHENRFWDILSDLCPTSVWRNQYLSSSFCVGAGQKVFVNGKVIGDTTWYNLNLQEVQPFYGRKQLISKHAAQPVQTLNPCFDTSFFGGSCLSYEGQLSIDGKPELFRLFDLDIKCNEPYIISYTYRAGKESKVFLEIEGTKDKETKALIFVPDTRPDNNLKIVSDKSSEKKEGHYLEIIMPQTVEDVCGNVSGQLSLPVDDEDWETRWFIMDPKQMEDFTLTSIKCGISSTSKEVQTIYIGQIQMFPKSVLRVPTISNIQCTQIAEDITQISWSCDHSSDVNYYIIFQDGSDGLKYLGRSATSSYLIHDISLSQFETSTFGIQAVLNIGLVTDVFTSKK